MLICILTKNVITSCSVTMMLFLHLEVKPLMTLTTVIYLSCALISGHLMEQLTKNQAVATSQEAVQNQNEPQLRDENAHNDKSVHGVLNPTYQAGLRRDAVQPDIEAERKKRDEIEAGK